LFKLVLLLLGCGSATIIVGRGTARHTNMSARRRVDSNSGPMSDRKRQKVSTSTSANSDVHAEENVRRAGSMRGKGAGTKAEVGSLSAHEQEMHTRMETMLKWIRDAGVKWNDDDLLFRVETGSDGSGGGVLVLAKRDLAPNMGLARIPKVRTRVRLRALSSMKDWPLAS